MVDFGMWCDVVAGAIYGQYHDDNNKKVVVCGLVMVQNDDVIECLVFYFPK